MELVVAANPTAGVIYEEGKEWLGEIGKRLIDKTGVKKARCYLAEYLAENHTSKWLYHSCCLISFIHLSLGM